jgi:hypothetical protein
MLDRAPRIDDATESLCHSDVMRVLRAAASCAARRAIDAERYARSITQVGQDFPSVPLLLRDPRMPLDPDQSHRMVAVAASFIEVLAHSSAAAEMLDRGTYTPIGRYDANPGPVHIAGKVALWRHEIAVPITVTRALVEERGDLAIARLLLETAALEFDKAMLSAKAIPRGLLHKVVPA